MSKIHFTQKERKLGIKRNEKARDFAREYLHQNPEATRREFEAALENFYVPALDDSRVAVGTMSSWFSRLRPRPSKKPMTISATAPALERVGNLDLEIPAMMIKDRIQQLAHQIYKDYKNDTPYLVCVLKGAFMFFAYLCSEFPTDFEFTATFVEIRSYSGTGKEIPNESMRPEIMSLSSDLSDGRRVLIIEDIVDTGETVCLLMHRFMSQHPKDVRICTLLHKVSKTIYDVKPSYVGFEIPDRFVVGFGLDLDEKYRHLLSIYSVA